MSKIVPMRARPSIRASLDQKSPLCNGIIAEIANFEPTGRSGRWRSQVGEEER